MSRAQELKHKRMSLMLSQLDVAMILDVSRMTYSKWEQNPESMPLGKYEFLMEELDRLKELKEK